MIKQNINYSIIYCVEVTDIKEASSVFTMKLP